MNTMIKNSNNSHAAFPGPGSLAREGLGCDAPTRDSREYVWAMTPELQDIVDTDPGMMAELLTLFLDDSASRLQTLSRACVREDFQIIRAQAHSLKGSALQIGACGLASLCAALEKSDRPGTEQREAMTHAIDDEFALVRRAIEQYWMATESSLTVRKNETMGAE